MLKETVKGNPEYIETRDYSGASIIFYNDHNKIVFKEIELFTPEFLCKVCRFTNKCNKEFSFVHLENNPLRIKKSITYDEFMHNYYRQICKLLEAFHEIELRQKRSI